MFVHPGQKVGGKISCTVTKGAEPCRGPLFLYRKTPKPTSTKITDAAMNDSDSAQGCFGLCGTPILLRRDWWGGVFDDEGGSFPQNQRMCPFARHNLNFRRRNAAHMGNERADSVNPEFLHGFFACDASHTCRNVTDFSMAEVILFKLYASHDHRRGTVWKNI